jgi:dTDP-4-dehydrorhamnose 3,5-epimerase
MNMDLVKTPLPGCFLVGLPEQKDHRGSFVKLFHEASFRANNLETFFPESYYSISRRGVLRGLHFQLPPVEHVKLVYCLEGQVLDAVVDLRKGSPTYGQCATFELSGPDAAMLYVPVGMAHGFYVKSESALVLYKVSTTYSPAHDAGILWSSAGIPWPSGSPVLSGRDETFPALADFHSPFIFPAEACHP